MTSRVNSPATPRRRSHSLRSSPMRTRRGPYPSTRAFPVGSATGRKGRPLPPGTAWGRQKPRRGSRLLGSRGCWVCRCSPTLQRALRPRGPQSHTIGVRDIFVVLASLDHMMPSSGARGIRRRSQPVEKPLYTPSEHPSRTQNPRHCSVLALISKCLDAVLDYPLVLLRLFYQAVRTREVHVESMLLRGHSSLTRWYATRNVGASASP